MQTRKKENHVSVYQHYLDCCKELEIPDIQQTIDIMIVLDYLILNEDRHMNNFGVIRNADTLEYLGAAPIYDSGTSLWFDKPTALIHGKTKGNCKPFKNTHEEQLKLLSDFDWLDLKALQGIDDEWRQIVKESLFIDQARCEAIAAALNQRLQMLEHYIHTMSAKNVYDDIRFDVNQDVVYSGEIENVCGNEINYVRMDDI